jgi:hypothetical protein
MTLTPEQIATRHMATEAEYINRLLAVRDISKAEAVRMMGAAALESAKAAGADVTIKYGVHQNRAWFNVL